MMKTRVMVSKIGQVNVKPSSKTEPCGICGKKMLNSVLCIYCGNLIHGSYAKIKMVTNRLGIDFTYISYIYIYHPCTIFIVTCPLLSCL